MSIVVSCPHCRMKFSLEPSSVGKSMQCPNLDCRQTFTVKAPGKPTEPPVPPAPPPPPPPRKSEPAEPVAAPAKPRKPEKPRPPTPPSKPTPPKPTVIEAEVVEAAIVEPPQVKEVVWGEGTDAPPPPPKAKKPVRAVPAEPSDEPDDLPIIRRKKKKDRRALFLIGGVIGIIVLAGGAALLLLKREGEDEEKLAKQADEQYAKKDFGAAAKTYEKLAAEYPSSENTDRYKFYSSLSNMRVTVEATTGRDNPEKGFETLKRFIGEIKGSPFAKFEKPGAGADILEAGKKLGDDIVGHAEDRVKEYRKDRAANATELAKAERTIDTGRALIPLLDPFKGTEPFDVLRAGLDRAQGEVKRERDRLAALAKASRDLTRVSDAIIQIVESELQAAGILADPEAQALLAAARGRLQDLVKYEKDPADPVAPPTNAAASILFVSPVGATRPLPAAEPGDVVQPSVFFAVARGILYALDEPSGTRLWAVRVGPDITEPPTVAKVNLGQGPTELAIVTSNLGGEPAIAGYVVREGTGVPRWYQPLTVPDPNQDPNKPPRRIPAPAAGPPVVVGSRLFVPLRDEQGSIYEFDLTTGIRKGRIRLAQPAGPATILRAGTGLLYATADARRVYVIDAPGGDTDTIAAEPQCVQVIATNHPPGTLRTAPLIIGPEGDGPGERWLVLAQADGPTSMKLRVFALPPISAPPADGKLPPETPATPTVELSVPGWGWFTPSSDGDRLSLVTDAGQFRLFGVKQPGNFDQALFPIPTPPLPTPPTGSAVPGLALPAEELAFWVMANGGMQKYRLALLRARSQELIPIGPFIPIGVPTQPPQLSNRKDSACLVVRALNSAGYKALVFNLGDGDIRWQRQLGVVPTTAPIPHEGGLLLVAEDGGIVLVPAASGAEAGQTLVAPASWVIATAPPSVTSPTSVAVSSDGKTVFTVTQVLVAENQKQMPKYLIRRITGGRVEESSVTAPAAIAGAPVVLGDSLLIPGADGIVYRHVQGTGRTNPDSLVAGPAWGGERRPADAVCYLTPLTNTGFLTNDGSKKLNHIEWAKGANWNPGAGKWELREPPAGPGVVVPGVAPGEPDQLLIADVTGSVWLYPGARGGAPIRRWRPGEELPAGKPTSGFAVQTNSPGNVTVAYTVDGKFLVCINPNDTKPRCVVKVSEDPDSIVIGAPRPAGSGQWLSTELTGRVTRFDEATKKPIGVVEMGLPGAVPATVAAMLGSSSVLAPASDGSAVVLMFSPPAEVLPEPKPKE